MKTLALAFIFLTAYGIENDKSDDKKTYYYYCKSRPWDMSTVTGKAEFKYTKITKVEANDNDLTVLTKEWANYMKANCNYGKCTSDFNYYYSFEQASQRQNAMLNDPENLNKFNFVEVDFK
ncbi:hypothetical protein [Runella sp.]|uniref:hypothetical protein n=1 Tax=Runella sp. TaxID=1960881 RepID=UPI003D0B5E4D